MALSSLEAKCIVMKAVQNRQEIVAPTCSVKLGEHVYIATGCGNKHRNIFQNFPKNCTLKFVTMPCPTRGY